MNLMAGVNKVGMNDNDGIFMCVCMLFMEFYVHMYIGILILSNKNCFFFRPRLGKVVWGK